MRSLRAEFRCCLFWLALPAIAADHTPPPVQPATSFPAVEVHADEHVAIAVEPYDTKEKESIFRVDYIDHDVMPVRLIVTNLGDRPISLRDARILFETAAGDRIQAAEPEDVERLMTRKERMGSKIPLPAPLPPIHTKPKGSNKEIRAGFRHLRVFGAGGRAAYHARGLSVLRCLRADPSAGGRQALRALAARRRRQRALLLRDSLQQISAVEVEPDELTAGEARWADGATRSR